MKIEEEKVMVLPLLYKQVERPEVPEAIKALKITCKLGVISCKNVSAVLSLVEMHIEAAYLVGLNQHKLN